MKRIFTHLIKICFLLSPFYGVAQTTVNISASADNTIYNDNQQNSNGAGANFTAGKNSGGSIRRGLLRFDLSSIPPGSPITSVTLRLVMNKSRTGTDIVSLYRLTKGWGEGGSDAGDPDGQGAPALAADATWNCGMYNGAGACTPPTTWTTPGGDFIAAASASASITNTPGTAFTWSGATMNSDVQGWVNSAATNFGWILRTAEGATQTTNRFSSRTHATVADRPRLTITYTAAAPVTLASFKGAESKAGILLSWQTQSEFNNSYFLVQHSLDGLSFTTIGKVNGKGNSSTLNNYSMEHQGVSPGMHYYRLVQTDFDGGKHISTVLLVSSKNRHVNLTISPNPASDLLNIAFGSVLQDYRIYNNSGSLMASGKIYNGEIRIGNLSSGNYLIRLTNSSGETAVGSFQKR